MKRIVFANDHALNNEMIAELTNHLNKIGYEVNHLGVKDSTSVDYPDMAKAATTEFLKGGYEFGLLVCGTGVGISVSANKVKGIFCSLIGDAFTAEATKKHNNPNFIAFGARVLTIEKMIEYIDIFVNAEFEGDRHVRRLNKVKDLDNR